MILSLPLLPLSVIPDAILYIQNESRNYKTLMEPLFEYIDSVWMTHVNPQLFCVHRIPNRINEAIIFPFQKLRDLLTSNQNNLFTLTEKLIAMDAWSKQNYEKLQEGKRVSVGTLVKFSRTVSKAWDDIESNPEHLKMFFEKVAPLISKLEGQIWIWGYYNYSGSNENCLITYEEIGEELYQHVEYLQEDDKGDKENDETKQEVEWEFVTEEDAVQEQEDGEEILDEEGNKPTVIHVGGAENKLITLEELSSGKVIYVEEQDQEEGE